MNNYEMLTNQVMLVIFSLFAAASIYAICVGEIQHLLTLCIVSPLIVELRQEIKSLKNK